MIANTLGRLVQCSLRRRRRHYTLLSVTIPSPTVSLWHILWWASIPNVAAIAIHYFYSICKFRWKWLLEGIQDISPDGQKPRARDVYSRPLCLKSKLGTEQKKFSQSLSAQAPAHPSDVYVMASEQNLIKACNNLFDVVSWGCGVDVEIHINMGRSMLNSYYHFLVLTTVDTYTVSQKNKTLDLLS